MIAGSASRAGRFYGVQIVVGLCLSLTGCFRNVIDVTGDTRYHGGYSVGDVYRLKSDVTLLPQVDDGNKHNRSFKGAYALGRDPAWMTGEPVGELARGTGVRVQGFKLLSCQVMPTYWVYYVVPLAKVVDGPHTGETVDLRGVSRGEGKAPESSHEMYSEWLWGPDPERLVR